jgi:uncharacterized protein YbjT (DUF2867 family)
MKPRRLFVAGSTGAVGRTLLGLAGGADVIPHARRPPQPPDPRTVVFDLGDAAALGRALRGCTTVLQLIGTMKNRFASGDTYEASDVGTTRQLADAAARAGGDHVVLLSSSGASASRLAGAYLNAKARAEAIVRDSGVPFTILRPGFFVGEGRKPPAALDVLGRLTGAWSWRPIPVESVARTILRVAVERAPLGEVLEGRALWDLAARG